MRIHYAAEESRQSIFGEAMQGPDVFAPVADIISQVRARGDAALFDYARRFDGAEPDSLRVPADEVDAAVASLPPETLALLQEAAEHIESYHRRQLRQGFEMAPRPGVTLGQKVLPLQRVGLYIPGGTASYPSTVLMNAIPARIAGVAEIVMVSPPSHEGSIAPIILAAAKVAGVSEIYRVGGAQAIAALAYGTDTIAPVDKVVGPGNAYVAEAKRQVFGQVGIDMIAGPSEILIVADSGANPAHLAADLLSQAEHDVNASAVLLTPDRALAEAVALQVAEQLRRLPRQDIARQAIESRGKIVVTASLDEAIALSNRLAPEHLELQVENAEQWLQQVTSAGSVFLGRWCPEAMGDYFAGPNHTLPTGGTARFFSALSVDDFVKKIQYSAYTREALGREAEKVAAFARLEGLEAHARSVESRLEDRA